MSRAQVSVDVVEVNLEKSKVGKAFKKEAKAVTDFVAGLSTEEINSLEKSINESG